MPLHAHLHVDRAIPFADASVRANRYVERAKRETDVAFYVASLDGATLVRGRHQLFASTTHHAAVTRRRTGGREVFGGEGIVYLAMGLSSASVFLTCPRDRVLNRNVRGALMGLTTSGAATHYFGRDFLSVQHAPSLYVGWTRDDEGFVMLEMFVSVARPYAELDELAQKEVVTLEHVLGRTVTVDEIVDRVVHRGYGAKYGIEILERARREDEVRHLEPGPSEKLRWSTERSVPIGVVQSGLRLDAGIIQEAALAGTFFEDESGPDRLNAALVGKPARPEVFVDAINRTYGEGGVVIEGLKTLQPILEGFLETGTGP